MLDPTPQATTPSRCYLLELPGELRNRIYDYVLFEPDTLWDAPTSKPGFVRLRPPPYPSYLNKYCPGHQECLRLKRWGRTIGFTQTCRAIRREFRPLFFNRLDIHLEGSLMYAPRYILDFFPQAGDTYGKCRLRIWREEMNSFDMLPLIQVLSKAPAFTLKYESWPRDEINFAALIDVNGNKKWREYVEKYVTRISYFPDTRSFVRPSKNQLFVNIRHTTGEPWMIQEKKEARRNEPHWIVNKTPANKPECVRKWLEFAGISHIDETLDDVGIQVAAVDEDNDSEASTIEDS